tara:strand:+ start:2043 stop:2822 length:780 start_codon:yes stop_codon:yes gene_type:complete
LKTVILCGGLGTRLSEETVIKPKPMVEIGGMPILWHIMKHYHHHGHGEFLLALGYKGDYIKKYFMDYKTIRSDIEIDLQSNKNTLMSSSAEDWKILLKETGSHSMTGGRLLRLRSALVNEESFMLTYGDGVSDLDISELIDFHNSHNKIATISAVRPPARFGTMVFEGSMVSEFKEKPQAGEGWINGGFFVFRKEIFDYLNDDSTILEREPLESLAENSELAAYRHEGFWQPMDTLRDKLSLEESWESGTAKWKTWNDD